ncbi:hypothetical protein [Brevundimonas sp.]|jgi:hypothetical protein|uniref:hypothetical protein n=1 Tax=Brevundimonas sp. TaxID=1871086 RepID=UPI00184AB8CA|nr:hypothetical protein [Brevundimonas sp.]MBA4806651.1 hypothetical protein [Brevundimonas sp.]
MNIRSLAKVSLLAAPMLLAAFALTAAPETAQAQVAAKVEAQTRPNFGVLLDPPTRSRPRANRRYDYGRYRGPAWRPLPRPPVQEEVVLVDCGGNPGSGAIESAVQRVRPGGTLIIRARGGACVGWLNIDKPMTIIGDSGFDPRRWDAATPTLQAPDGLPCLTVAQGVRVEVRDLVFASPRGGDAACVVGYNAELIMSRVGFRHAGDEAAIYADGGLLDLRDVLIDARTVSAAVVADGAVATLYETVITGAQTGVELTPGAGGPSTLSSVTLIGSEQPNNFGPRAIGVIVRASRDYGQVAITNAKICGYVEGVAIEGASVSVSKSKICKGDKGAVLYNGELLFDQNRVRVNQIGVAAASGRAVVTGNSFAGVRSAIYEEERAIIDARDNRVWSQDLCRPRFEHRYRGRYGLYEGGSRSYDCQYSPYPRDWWQAEDGPYFDYGYALDGYDRYRQGYGWYDRDGRYVSDNRYFGDDRWNRGGGWFN